MSLAPNTRSSRSWEGEAEEAEKPLFKVVSGEPTAEELAALTACLMVATASTEEPEESLTRNDLVREAIKRGRHFMQLPTIWRGNR
ncbi:acyl-CoA carboxylase subunit epsilon [Neomicrococcus aestuarii]|uniref:Acyl-CoA carboxylase subunit epsilon n=1 Tax=Neomicrococcus aestuarii TaxID=556325 RepID=A0A1L2ZMU6_9MICC|nr:acyl-CoA carboxylase subunit epsilon [Neomicrococcus aestuarii]APF40436.1 hypothetical protein BHE16_04740 [Neomicrococcus aestuarii]